MTTETNTPATDAAPDAVAEQQQEQQPPRQVSPPAHAPIPGTKYVLNEKTGFYDVHRVDDEGHPTVDKGENDLPSQEEGKPTDASGIALEIPGHVPKSVQYDENIQGALHELGGILRESAIKPEVAQSYVDVYAEYALESPATEVDPANPGAVHAQLKALWGETYGTRWGHVLKAWNALSSKNQEWVANHAEHPVAMFRTLAAIGSGTFSVSREQAQEAVDKMRADKKGPLYDVSHKDHRLVRDTYRNLSLLANREDKPKGRQADVKDMVNDRTAKEPAGDSPEAKIDAELKQLRLDPAYLDKSKPNHKVVIERVRELYRQRYPD